MPTAFTFRRRRKNVYPRHLRETSDQGRGGLFVPPAVSGTRRALPRGLLSSIHRTPNRPTSWETLECPINPLIQLDSSITSRGLSRRTSWVRSSTGSTLVI